MMAGVEAGPHENLRGASSGARVSPASVGAKAMLAGWKRARVDEEPEPAAQRPAYLASRPELTPMVADMYATRLSAVLCELEELFVLASREGSSVVDIRDEAGGA